MIPAEPGSDIHEMLALCCGSGEVVVTDEQQRRHDRLHGTAMRKQGHDDHHRLCRGAQPIKDRTFRGAESLMTRMPEERCAFREWIPILPLLLGQNVVVGSIVVLLWGTPLSLCLPIIRRAARSVSALPGEGCILAHIRVPQTVRAAAGVVLWCKGRRRGDEPRVF